MATSPLIATLPNPTFAAASEGFSLAVWLPVSGSNRYAEPNPVRSPTMAAPPLMPTE